MRASMKRWQWVIVRLALLPFAVAGQSLNLSPSFAGEAFALQLTQPGGGAVTLAATAPTPFAGGKQESSQAYANLAPVLSAESLYAATAGFGGRNDSQAALAHLDATLGAHRVIAFRVQAQAMARAEFLNIGASGTAGAYSLFVDGQPVAIGGEPNQTITFPDGRLIINEQTGSSGRQMGTITVNALHLIVNGGGSLIAASATATVINEPTANTIPR